MTAIRKPSDEALRLLTGLEAIGDAIRHAVASTALPGVRIVRATDLSLAGVSRDTINTIADYADEVVTLSRDGSMYLSIEIAGLDVHLTNTERLS